MNDFEFLINTKEILEVFHQSKKKSDKVKYAFQLTENVSYLISIIETYQNEIEELNKFRFSVENSLPDDITDKKDIKIEKLKKEIALWKNIVLEDREEIAYVVFNDQNVIGVFDNVDKTMRFIYEHQDKGFMWSAFQVNELITNQDIHTGIH